MSDETEVEWSCENCRFYMAADKTIGQCRRRAPSAGHGWPKVRSVNFCGEFEDETHRANAPGRGR
jgi:hypothetical protein